MGDYRKPRTMPAGPHMYTMYRTKDFRAEPMKGGGYRIIGGHEQARLWLVEHAGNGFRKQFMDESGYLRAEDATEVEALIIQLQAEHG